MKKVLILEDEENIRSFVVINLKRAGYEAIEAGEKKLYDQCAAGLSEIRGIRLLAPDAVGFGPLLFDSDLEDNGLLARALFKRGVCVREGFHCAPLAHRSIGSDRRGGIRVSLSPFNTARQVDAFLRILKNEYDGLR